MQKQKTSIRVGALLLAVLMVLCILPIGSIAAFADGGGGGEGGAGGEGGNPPCLHDGETHREGAVAATCTAPGATGNLICNQCNAVIEESTEIQPLGHNIADDAWVVTQEPTCTEKGSKKATCPTCNEEVVEEIDALGHDTEIVGAKEATADEDGYTGDEVCKVCHETITQGQVIPKTAGGGNEGGNEGGNQGGNEGGNQGGNEGGNQGGNEGGNEGGNQGGNEGGNQGGEDPNPPAPCEHTPGAPAKENVVKATCTTDGSYDEVIRCTKCKAVIGEPVKKTTPATGHSWGEWKVTKEASEESTGTKTRVCALCNKEETETIPQIIPAYEFATGQHGTWYVSSGVALPFRVTRNPNESYAYGKFKGIQVDGNTITPNNYSASSSGGLSFSLSGAYLQTLPATQHQLKVVFEDGEASTDFTVVNQSTSKSVGKTGDSSNIMIYSGLLVVSMLGAASVVLYKKVKKDSE